MVEFYGIKVGSKYTAVMGHDMEKVEVLPTCVAELSVLDSNEVTYKFGSEAEYYSNVRFPILHGMAKEGERDEFLLNKFLLYLKDRFSIPSDSFITFCFPAMRTSDKDRFKMMLKNIDWGKHGIHFSLEAFCGAISALGGINEAAIPPYISTINFGSSTTEFIVFENLHIIGGEEGPGMRTEALGGSDIDDMISSFCSEQSRGADIGSDTARRWKEKYADLDDPKPFTERIFIRSKKKSEEVTFPEHGNDNPIVLAYNEYTKKFLDKYDKFLGGLKEESEKAHNALINGIGVFVCTGGVVNTRGFPRFITSEIKKKFGNVVRIIISDNGITAPAVGAYMMSRYVMKGK